MVCTTFNIANRFGAAPLIPLVKMQFR